MDDEVPGPAEPSDEPEPTPVVPPLPPAVTSDADELRRLIDAGASSPEELRALAARIRDHKALEESLWRAEVRPSLLKSKKRRFSLKDLVDRPEESTTANTIGITAAICGVVLALFLVATQSSVLLILIPVAGVLVYAYLQGRQEPSEAPATPEPPAEGPAD